MGIFDGFHQFLEEQRLAEQAPAPAPAPAPATPSGGFFGNAINAINQQMEAQAPTLEQTYQTVLGRAPDAGGLAYWQQQFGDKVSPAELEVFKQAAIPELNRPYEDLYQEVLGRAPDPEGLTNWQKQFGNSIDETEKQYFLKAAAPELAKTQYNQPAYDASGNQYAKVEDLYRDVLGRASDKSGLDYWTAQFGNVIDPNEVKKFRSAAGAEFSNRVKANPLDAIALYQSDLNEGILSATPQNIAQFKDLKFTQQPEYEAKWIDPATGQPTTDASKGILTMVEKPRVLDYAASGFTPEKTGQAGKEVTTYRKPVSTLLDAIYDARGNLQGYVASKRAELGNGNYVNAYYDPKGKVNSVYGKVAPKKADGGSIGGLNQARRVDVSKLKPIKKMVG